MWSPSTCNCEYNKALDIKNFSCEKRVIGM